MAKQTVKNGTQTFRKPKRFFEKYGSVNPRISYYVPLDNVVNRDNQDIKTMIDLGRYFSMFAPRQSGKTTFLKRLCEQLHRDPVYVAIQLSFQKYRKLQVSRFYSLVEKELYEQLLRRLNEVECEKTGAVGTFLESHRLTDHIHLFQLFKELNRMIRYKKIVVFIDEFDGIPLTELENFLTALRDLYLEYKEEEQKALYSVGLIGIRNIVKLVIGGVSPFNIADQVDLPPFSLENIRDLYGQYTAETHQPFTAEAVSKVHDVTAGQPWLVNRLGTILTVNVKPGVTEPIDEQDVDRAVQILLTERNDHFDNLYEKAKLYKETFVKVVFDGVKYNPDDEDLTWLEQYGLIKKQGTGAVVANDVYRRRYVDTFFNEAHLAEEIPVSEYVLPGGQLDMERIIFNFEKYITQIGVEAFYREKKPYEKTGQFLLTAWLYQFVRGGEHRERGEGELRYEVRSGLGRMDMILTYRGHKYIVETKLNRGSIGRTVKEGVTQVVRKYLATESARHGYLVIFDIKTPVGEETDPREHHLEGKKVTAFTIGIGRLN